MTTDTSKRFMWDFPTQGMVFHRSIDQAFKTAAAIEIQGPHRVSVPDAFAYTVAVALLAASVFLALN